MNSHKMNKILKWTYHFDNKKLLLESDQHSGWFHDEYFWANKPGNDWHKGRRFKPLKPWTVSDKVETLTSSQYFKKFVERYPGFYVVYRPDRRIFQGASPKYEYSLLRDYEGLDKIILENEDKVSKQRQRRLQNA